MKVLLLQDVKKVGRRNEIKEVSDGYARNFLIPKKLAMPADEAALKIKKATDEKEAELVAKLKNLSEKLKNDILEFRVKSGKEGEVFGSVSAEQIKKSLEEKGYGKTEVLLEKPLRLMGNHKVGINFGRGIRGEATVKLSPQR
jgi:large subunit ribosomal protein L9